MTSPTIAIGVLATLFVNISTGTIEHPMAIQFQARSIGSTQTENFTSAQSHVRTPPPSAQVSLSHGTYSNDMVRLSLSLNTFQLTDMGSGSTVEGDFEIVDGMLALTNPRSSGADMNFPIICRVERFGPGIRLRDETGQCEVYHDMLLREER